jgi:hypothetical protein
MHIAWQASKLTVVFWTVHGIPALCQIALMTKAQQTKPMSYSFDDNPLNFHEP